MVTCCDITTSWAIYYKLDAEEDFEYPHVKALAGIHTGKDVKPKATQYNKIYYETVQNTFFWFFLSFNSLIFKCGEGGVV